MSIDQARFEVAREKIIGKTRERQGIGTLSEKTIIMDEKGFDANTITEDDVNKYGI